MANYKDKKDDAIYDISDSGHAYENRQEIYYNAPVMLMRTDRRFTITTM